MYCNAGEQEPDRNEEQREGFGQEARALPSSPLPIRAPCHGLQGSRGASGSVYLLVSVRLCECVCVCVSACVCISLCVSMCVNMRVYMCRCKVCVHM